MYRPHRHPVFPLLLTLALISCASGATSTSGGGGNPDRITSEELASLSTADAYEAIQQLRPRWLSSRDAREPVRVVVNGAVRGEVSELRQMPVTTIREMRYLDGRDATTRFGVGYGAGAIMVTTR